MLRSRPRGALTATAAAVTVASMIATPLARPRGDARRVLSTAVVAGLCVTTTARATRRWGMCRAAGAAASVAATTLAIERVGTRTGVPFGRYRYTGALRPAIGGVPAVVPMAWFAMALPARETAHAALGARSTTLTRVMTGAGALTAWDLFLDPQMVGEGYWQWARRGRYRGIPLGNYVGWFVTGLGVMALLEVLVPADRPADAVAVGEYGVMAVMETVGFAAFFRDRVVAAAGGIAMVPIAALALTRLAPTRVGP